MKTKLITRRPKRLFTFGCSFTKWKWPTWPHIIAYDLSIPLYNYGKGGAGNQYIFNTLMQADIAFNFNSDDLIMICWTNIFREDRYRGLSWETPGNIFTQETYDKKYVSEWANSHWYARRDFATIKASMDFLDSKGCQVHFMKMLDFHIVNQWDIINNCPFEAESISTIEAYYTSYLSRIEKSFYEVLWNNDLGIIFHKATDIISHDYNDGHPFVDDHYQYLENVFDHNFSENTKLVVNETHNDVVKKIKDFFNTPRKSKYYPEFDISENYFIKSQPIFLI